MARKLTVGPIPMSIKKLSVRTLYLKQVDLGF